MNERTVGCPTHGTRTIDLNGPEPMCSECRVLGPDGKPLGWADGLPTQGLHRHFAVAEAQIKAALRERGITP